MQSDSLRARTAWPALLAALVLLHCNRARTADPEEVQLRVPTDFMQVASFSEPSVVSADWWLSTPARTAEGAVYGLVQAGPQKSFVRIVEATGKVRWRTPTASFAALQPRGDHFDGWASPPMALVRDSTLLVAGARDWALVDVAGGAIRRTGTLDAQLPDVSAASGLCAAPGGFWIGVTDPRDGGVFLSDAGVLTSARVARPAECPARGGVENVADFALAVQSPLQNAHQSTAATTLPCVGDGRMNRGSVYCASHVQDDAGHEVIFYVRNPVFRTASFPSAAPPTGWRGLLPSKAWRSARLPATAPRLPSEAASIELGQDLLFLDRYETYETKTQPGPQSFAAATTATLSVDVVAALAPDGTLAWQFATSPAAPLAESGALGGGPPPHRSTLFASNPSSASHLLYVTKPGWLLAVDQATGAPRFRYGTPPR